MTIITTRDVPSVFDRWNSGNETTEKRSFTSFSDEVVSHFVTEPLADENGVNLRSSVVSSSYLIH